ncbi:fungal-specific transcription factor domain-containing protein [Annulohypoxylon maeteangense]|uniref:fungal-specific transcription factor domain-containing protein n=1 Tax=Annulohypoxylon maeteangense TaxID=1927788 RepID=UPI002008D25A|nr:fungal-specific transcription factor domain-containing protein [Annulohypoxylon maeteangense]KAI0885814.1 fungal-specific transcription factor domain-containing protein [Annulohypoxylon maeteangense]
MSQVPAVAISAATPGVSSGVGLEVPDSASPPEKHASAGTSPRGGTASSPSGGVKLRSCVTCRTRKVRCDKLSPCSNCRRAKIPCVFPNLDKPPRWARRLERIANSAKAAQESDPSVNQVMDRLRSLEGLVKELTGQLEQANAGVRGSPSANSPEHLGHDRDVSHQIEPELSVENMSKVQSSFGRLVLGDAGQSRYVSSGFWSRVNDELHGLKMDTEGLAGGDYDSSGDEDSPGKTPSTQELDRTPSERHAFLFRNNLNSPSQDLREFHPLPSQIPFLLNVFSENVNIMVRIVHIPTVYKMVQDAGSNLSSLTPANEALMFAIYYASVTSMEEDDIIANFGSTKPELNLKYRLGLEYALAKADFLNVPDIILLQAFVIFLFLLRRHDSPRFVWMMTGLAIRMGQALGLQRDGSRFPNLTPYEVEMRRRVWWALCAVDVRASEDQGTDLTITQGSFDTRFPLNINDSDINPETKETPKEREGLTDMTFSIVFSGQTSVTQKLMALSLKDGTSRLDEQTRLINEFYEQLKRTYLQYSHDTSNIGYWVTVTVTRLLVAKMSLIIYFPVLFCPHEHPSDTESLRAKLFVAAVEVAEYNHALNAELACRNWRWIFQTYTHWYAIVYMLIEASRRPWSPAVERAWVALHSRWLIPARHADPAANQNIRFWVPLRKLLAKARRHRDEEVRRLRNDGEAARVLERVDCAAQHPASSGPFPGADGAESFRERWRRLVGLEGPGVGGMAGFAQTAEAGALGFGAVSQHDTGILGLQQDFESSYLQHGISQDGEVAVKHIPSQTSPGLNLTMPTEAPTQIEAGLQHAGSSYSPFASGPTDLGPGFGAWLWADADPSVDVFANIDAGAADFNMELDGEIDWNNWIESAKGMELSGEQPPADGWA